MEEQIKLVIIFILSLCTLLKFRTTWNNNHQISTHKPQVQQDTRIQEESDDSVDADTIARNDNLLFPPTHIPPSTQPPPSNYRNSITGTIFEEDSINHYNNKYLTTNPFAGNGRRIVRTNEEYLREIQHLLVEQSTCQAQSIPLPPMSVEESSPEEPRDRLKHKNITKRRKFGKKKQRPHPQIHTQPQPQLFSRLPLQGLKRKKRAESVIDIEKQIQKRYEEIRVLERLKRRGAAK